MGWGEDSGRPSRDDRENAQGGECVTAEETDRLPKKAGDRRGRGHQRRDESEREVMPTKEKG